MRRARRRSVRRRIDGRREPDDDRIRSGYAGHRTPRQRAAAAPRRDDRARRRHRRRPLRRLQRGDPRRRAGRARQLRDRRRHRLSRDAHAGRDGGGATGPRLVQHLHPRGAWAPRGLRLGVALLVLLDHRRRRRDDRRRGPVARLDRAARLADRPRSHRAAHRDEPDVGEGLRRVRVLVLAHQGGGDRRLHPGRRGALRSRDRARRGTPSRSSPARAACCRKATRRCSARCRP